MADGLGLLGSSRLEDFRARNADVLSGPTPEELLASRSTARGLDLAPDAGSGLGLGDIARGAGSLLSGAGRAIGEVLSLPREAAAYLLRGRSAAEIDAELAEERKAQNAIRLAQARQANVSAAVQGIQYIAPIANSVASIEDAEKRAQVAAQARAQIVDELGTEASGALFDSFVERQAIARLQLKELVPSLQKTRSFQAAMLKTNGDLTQLEPDEITGILTEAAKEGARENLKSLRGTAREVNRIYEQLYPPDAEAEGKSDRGLSVSEFYARLSDPAVREQIPELQDPRAVAQLRDAVEFFAPGLNLRPDEEIAKGRGQLKVAVVGGRPTYVTASEAEGLEAPQGGVTVNVGGLKGAKEGTFQNVLAETGNARLAAAVAEGNAYREPILGEYVFGGDVDRRKAEGRKAFLSAIGDLRAAAQDVVAAYPDTDALTEVENRIQRGLAAGDPVLERYEQARNQAAFALQQAVTGAQAAEKELARYLQQLPTVRALAKGGKITDTARRLFDGLQQKIVNEHVATFPVEDQPRVAATLRKRTQVQSAVQQAEAKLGPSATDEAIEAEARRILGEAP